MARFIDLTGKKFGRLFVLCIAIKGKHSKWFCKCDCGNFHVAQGDNMKSGDTRSCGCLLADKTRERRTKHSHTLKGKRSPEYTTWAAMIQRCTNPNHHAYENYGGRGICVDESWLNSFDKFYEDMGKKPSFKYSIDRNDVNGNYCKENCSWEDRFTQAKNTRMSKTNSTGVRGVHLNKRKNTYQAYICYKGKKEVKSGFKTIAEAADFRKTLELKYWGKSS